MNEVLAFPRNGSKDLLGAPRKSTTGTLLLQALIVQKPKDCPSFLQNTAIITSTFYFFTFVKVTKLGAILKGTWPRFVQKNGDYKRGYDAVNAGAIYIQ